MPGNISIYELSIKNYGKSLNNGQECRKPVFMRFPAFVLSNGSSLALFVRGVIGINLISAVGVIMKMDIRVATLEDVQIVAKLAIQMWKSHTIEELARKFYDYISQDKGRVFIAVADAGAVGFAQCGLRHDYVDSTASSPVGYLEGIFIKAEYRKRGLARDLLETCQKWAKEQGCTEFASDCGSLVTLLQDGTDFVRNNSKKAWRKVDDGRIEMPDYPDRAVFEGVVNALIHRNYMEIGSEVHIDMFDDGIEKYSLGGMVSGISLEGKDLLKIPSKRRNPILADIFSRLKYMECRGSGFKKILADYEG